jgi:hypothetical protein
MVGLPAAQWPQILRLYKIARFVADHPRLHLIHLHSFGCGIDAAIISAIERIIRKAKKLYTAIKLDEMADPASLRIRLRSLDHALKTGSAAKKKKTDKAIAACSNSTATTALSAIDSHVLPLPSPPSVTKADIERGLALLNNDLCYPLLAWGGHILRKAEHSDGGIKIELDLLCDNCRGTELQQLLNVVLSADKQLKINKTTVGQTGDETFFAHPLNAGEQSDQSGAPRIGVIGNAAMLFTPEFNDNLLDRIIAEGAIPVTPSKQAVRACKRPLPELLPVLYKQGIRDFIFVQSFGCLRSHVDARGALPRLKAEFSDCNISFLEYDPGVSQINQLSRLRLAVTIAFERQSKAQ